MIEGDIFKIIVPLDDGYSADSGNVTTQSTTQTTRFSPLLTEQDLKIVDILRRDSTLSQKEISIELSMDINTVKYYVKKLKKMGVLEREGNARGGKWVVRM